MLGRKGVRTAVANFFAPPNVAGLNSVYSGEPRLVTSNAYFAGQKSGAVGWPYIESQKDRRIAFTGGPQPGGGQAKLIIYEVAFSYRFLSYQAKAEDALDDNDNGIDALTARIRSDRTFGGTLWQVGEGDTVMGEDIHVMSGPGPKVRKQDGPIIIWSMVRFIAIEAI